MDLDTFIVAVYCLVDELMEESLGGERLRSRGPDPVLDDREVLTVEIVGEFLGIDTDKGIFGFFRRHYAEWFPKLDRVHRTTFARQAANLWSLKRRLWRRLLVAAHVEHDEKVSLVDSFAVPVCGFAKAPRHKSFAGLCSNGFDAMAKAVFFGFDGHLRVAWPGVIVSATLAPASEHDRWVAEYDLLGEVGEGSFVVGDTNYHQPHPQGGPRWIRRLPGRTQEDQQEAREAPLGERHPWPRWLTNVRRRIETVISQMVERYGAKRVRARDLWHLTSRWFRKILGHTCCVCLCQRTGLAPLRFSELVTI